MQLFLGIDAAAGGVQMTAVAHAALAAHRRGTGGEKQFVAHRHITEQGVETRFQRRQLRDRIEQFDAALEGGEQLRRSEEHTSELQSLMRISYAVFCLKNKN